MARRFVFLVMLLFGVSMTAAAQAPFCVVTTYTRDCGSYYDSQTCREQAAAAGGICVVNPEAQPAQPAPANRGPQGIDFGAVTRGQRQAQEDIRAQQQERRAQEEHVARMRMLQAQQQAAQAAAASQAPVYAAPQVPVASQAARGNASYPGFAMPTSTVFHSSCVAFVQAIQQGRETPFFDNYCYGLTRGFVIAHSRQTSEGVPALFCIGDARILDVLRKLIVVPPDDPNGRDFLYLRDRLVADWPC